MQSREQLQLQDATNDESQETVPPDLETINQTTPSDTINRLAELLFGIYNRPSALTLMLRPVSTTTLTFDVKSEKFEFFEHLLNTMMQMQPDMTKTIKIKHFHSLLRKSAL